MLCLSITRCMRLSDCFSGRFNRAVCVLPAFIEFVNLGSLIKYEPHLKFNLRYCFLAIGKCIDVFFCFLFRFNGFGIEISVYLVFTLIEYCVLIYTCCINLDTDQ